MTPERTPSPDTQGLFARNDDTVMYPLPTPRVDTPLRSEPMKDAEQVELREKITAAIVEWAYRDPPVGPQKVLIGCDFDSLADRILSLFSEYAVGSPPRQDEP
jgi:hypothetical protein